MPRSAFFALCAALLLSAVHSVPAQMKSEKAITDELNQVRSVSDEQRPAFERQIALEIRALPAGLPKLTLAVQLASLVTEGDPGLQTLQAVTDTFTVALREHPMPTEKDGSPGQAYRDLARLTHYEGTTSTLNDPQFKQADRRYTANDADAEKLDFTLTDIHGKQWTRSQLRGKIVLLNFWATWCPPCRKEMPTLNGIYSSYKDKNLVMIAVTDEDLAKVAPFMERTDMKGIQYPMLLDPGRKVADQFHVESIPQTFVFDAKGKLAVHATDMRTEHQFLLMLTKAGLPVQK